MSLILAVEPDRRQAAQLTGVIRQYVGAELILADTTEGALVAIGRRVPDLVLVPALLAPQDDAALASALRVIAAAAHVQTLTIPVFSNGVRKPAARKGMFARLGLGREEDAAPAGCEPSVFAEQVISYLKEAATDRQAAEEANETFEVEAPAPAFAPEQPSELRLGRPDTESEPPVELVAAVEELVAPEPLEPEDPAERDEDEEEDQGIDLSDELSILCDDEENSELEEEAVAVYSLDMDPGFEVTGMLEAMIDAPLAAAASVESTLEANDDDTIAELKAALDEPLPEPSDEVWEDEPEFDDEPDSNLWMPLSLGPCWPPMHVTVFDGRPVVFTAAAASAPAAASESPLAAAGDGDAPKSEWVELIESLRLDIERLKTTPARKPAPPKPTRPEAASSSEPANKSTARPAGKRQPVQDEWGFFDPEQCGFAALLAKLDEITDTPEDVAPRSH